MIQTECMLLFRDVDCVLQIRPYACDFAHPASGVWFRRYWGFLELGDMSRSCSTEIIFMCFCTFFPTFSDSLQSFSEGFLMNEKRDKYSWILSVINFFPTVIKSLGKAVTLLPSI